MAKFYMPSNLVNSNYDYYFTNANSQLVVFTRTHSNCRQINNQTQCNCYMTYINQNYFTIGPFECRNDTTISPQMAIPTNLVTSDIWYRNDIAYILIIFLILFIFIIKYPMRLFMRLFGRWLKL